VPVPRVLIVGGGFGGLWATRALARAPVAITLLDRRNHHVFQPLLYQVATAALNPSDVAEPIRAILRRQPNVTVLLAEVDTVDIAAKRVHAVDGAVFEYDYLILAAGATHSYFGRDDWAPRAPGLKTIEDALEIRRRVFLAYEAAERETDEVAQAAWLTFVVIGAGPTGVELAGALAEIARHALGRDFRRIDPRRARVLLLEGADRVLSTFTPKLSPRAQRQLETLGVEVRLGARVTAVDGDGVAMGSERIAARTVLWAAGVQASPLARSLGVPLDRVGRVRVSPTLAVPGHDDVFVIGDLATLEQDGKPLPGVAPAAMQEGEHAARNIERAIAGRPLEPFHYRDRGSFATIGRGAAVGSSRGLRFSGFIAWMAWLAIHIYFLIGFRHRLFVFLQWAYQYLTYRRGARLITGVSEPFAGRTERL
jgi:NADH dehydrogenase